MAKEVGAGVLRVRKLLQIAGVIGPDTPNNAVFAAQAGYRAVRDDLAALPFLGAAKHLGINLKQARLFAEAGLIEPVAEGPLRLRARFAPAALDAFLAKLLAGATPVRRKGADHTTIPETSLRTSCQQTEIAELILNGKVKWIGCLGAKRDFTSILVKLSEVDAAIHGLDPDTLSVAEFAKQACLKKQAAQILVKRGIVRSITRKRAGHQVGRVPRGEVDAFRRRYVTLGELSRNRRKHHATVLKSLEAHGIPRQPLDHPFPVEADDTLAEVERPVVRLLLLVRVEEQIACRQFGHVVPIGDPSSRPLSADRPSRPAPILGGCFQGKARR